MDWFMTYGLTIVFAAILSLVIFLLMVGPMSILLGANSRIKKARPFFTMALFIILLLGGIAPVINVSLNMAEDTPSMEYVWNAAQKMQTTMIYLALFLFGFCIVTTVLAASLGRRDD